MLNIHEIRKNPDGLDFEVNFDLVADLKGRNPEILGIRDVLARGKAQYEDGLYFLDYDLSYTITLASSRSMEPVERKETYLVNEIFMENHGEKISQDLIDDDLVLGLEGDEIDLAESVADNILLNIPLQVLTAEEAAGQEFPVGQDSQVMTEEEYRRQQQEQKASKSPFARLKNLFDEEN